MSVLVRAMEARSSPVMGGIDDHDDAAGKPGFGLAQTVLLALF
jgi:hypothetical protein